MSDYLLSRLTEGALTKIGADHLIMQARDRVAAANRLADEVERRLNDLGGYDRRFPVRQALDEYRKLQKERQDG